MLLMLVAPHVLAAANHVPRFDIEPSCQAAAEAAVVPSHDAKVCKREETLARGKLEDEWIQFTSAEKEHCSSLTKLGGNPSYVELLTCLELAKTTKDLPPNDRNIGQGLSD